MAINMAMTIITATAIPAGVILPPESFFELFGVSAAVRGFVGTAVEDMDEALVVVVAVVEASNELELVVVVVGSDEDDTDLVDVRTAGAVIVMPFSSSSSSLSLSFGSGEAVGAAEASSESVGVGVGSMLITLETKLSRGSRTCRSPSGVARAPRSKKKDRTNRNKCLIVASKREEIAGDTLLG